MKLKSVYPKNVSARRYRAGIEALQVELKAAGYGISVNSEELPHSILPGTLIKPHDDQSRLRLRLVYSEGEIVLVLVCDGYLEDSEERILALPFLAAEEKSDVTELAIDYVRWIATGGLGIILSDPGGGRPNVELALWNSVKNAYDAYPLQGDNSYPPEDAYAELFLISRPNEQKPPSGEPLKVGDAGTGGSYPAPVPSRTVSVPDRGWDVEVPKYRFQMPEFRYEKG
ncbi:hypothetical protein [Parafrankia sp. BMG5.11]|uniref:hypothetical protein n=1 Tax=Parafrankia sp. BMG5.11 TaxID=222540 RepID=UPI00103A0ADC|nr:hypothetical protein [Parafrankia sp. BMG5.11]TCJ35204.1 hypothetical protein E0504_29385 [Parafrankia sp. BMG5.11]